MKTIFDYNIYTGSIHLDDIYASLTKLIYEKNKLDIENTQLQRKIDNASMYPDETNFYRFGDYDREVEVNKLKLKEHSYRMMEFAQLANMDVKSFNEIVNNKDNNNGVYLVCCQIIDNWIEKYSEHLKQYLIFRETKPRNNSHKKELKNNMLGELKELSELDRTFTKYLKCSSLIQDSMLLALVKEKTSVIPFDMLVASRFVSMVERYRFLKDLSDHFESSHSDDIVIESTSQQATALKAKIVEFNKRFAPSCKVDNLFESKAVKEFIKARKVASDKQLVKEFSIR